MAMCRWRRLIHDYVLSCQIERMRSMVSFSRSSRASTHADVNGLSILFNTYSASIQASLISSTGLSCPHVFMMLNRSCIGFSWRGGL
ncbi:hypothetical protein K443DRAFT_576239 [Laccaria amethystina LaAM-08-1]|uniref:Uncharacterized protein n=1 Tax=Laccaria amethystina LaAM-08-1 TaxID=1095629 RepID=A0A0C9X0J4_9AGAR|nr:hypothetical protein K443DRAFT_576239 [Laccaria amethystina LaAM-08-1]